VAEQWAVLGARAEAPAAAGKEKMEVGEGCGYPGRVAPQQTGNPFTFIRFWRAKNFWLNT